MKQLQYSADGVYVWFEYSYWLIDTVQMGGVFGLYTLTHW